MGRSLKVIVTLILGSLFGLGIAFVDFEYITPLVPLPTDACYYHAAEAPFWVRLLYLDHTGHIEPEANILHLLLILALGITSAGLIVKKLFESN